MREQGPEGVLEERDTTLKHSNGTVQSCSNACVLLALVAVQLALEARS